MASSSKKRRLFTKQEISDQLQQLYLFSTTSLTSPNYSDVEALGPILLNIHKSRQQDAYLTALNQFVHDKENEIEEVCANNYQDFVSSVSSLLKVRQGTISLKHRVVELNEDVQTSGGGVADKKKALLDARRVGQNIDEAIDTLQSCLRVLDMDTKVNTSITSGRYFSALRQLSDLQTVHLKPLLHHPFASLMLSSIPHSRNSIREEVTKSLKAWLYEARNSSRLVGKGALDAMEARGRRWNARKKKEMQSGGMGTGLGLAKVNGPLELGISERHEFNPLDNELVKIDFKPLYQCIHIYETLDALEELQLGYQSDRRAQAFLLLSLTTSHTPLSLSTLSSLLEEIVGFFLIESHVLRSTNSFRQEQDVEDLWDGMCERVVEIVDRGLEGCEDTEMFLGTKAKVLTFVQTLEGYNYSVGQLNNLLLTLFKRYSELLQRKFSGDFEQIVFDDDHQSMVVKDKEEFDKVISVSWLPADGEWSSADLEQSGFPLALPFSQTYPLCCIDIRSFTEQYYQFAEGFAEQDRGVDDVLRNALDTLLITKVSENIQKRLPQISNLSQLAQIVVNVLFFQTACSDLETLLITLRATQRGGPIHLSSLASFQTTLRLTQETIVSNVSSKFDNFFEEASYAWESTTPPSPRAETEPSGYLMDMTDYLNMVMMSVLVALPEFVKDFVVRGAFVHCADILMSFLLDRQPQKISDVALNHLAKDVRWLSSHVSNLPNQSLQNVFDGLSQLLKLLTATPNLTNYLNLEVRQNQFPDVKPRTVQTVLYKLSGHYSSSAGSRVDPRRKAGVEELLRGLQR